jgi:hypothetical protein
MIDAYLPYLRKKWASSKGEGKDARPVPYGKRLSPRSWATLAEKVTNNKYV